MKNLSVIIVTTFFIQVSCLCFSQTYEWARSIGSEGEDYSSKIVVDGSGNIYITGRFHSAADFDPGIGNAILISSGYADIFLAKYNANGNYRWAINFGSTMDDYSCSNAVDSLGNIYITGSFQGTVDFDPSAGIANLTAVGNADIFFAKYDSSGNYIWAKNIGSLSDDCGINISSSVSGNICITGYFNGIADFDPGPGIKNLTSAGSKDIFFAKYDANGNYLFAERIGSTNEDLGVYISVDGLKNIYITGRFYGTADFDPGTGTANLTANSYGDIFFAKYDSSGNYTWAKSIGSSDINIGYNIITDNLSNVYLTGSFYGTADFNPSSSGVASLTAIGTYDIFFAKYDSNGNLIWAKNIGSPDTDLGYSLAIDNLNNIYLVGGISGTDDFDPGIGIMNLTPVGAVDVFLSKYDSNGNYIWAKNIGSPSDDICFSIAINGPENIFITGGFSSFVDFDPGPGTVLLDAIGGVDIFFAKYSQITGIGEPVAVNPDDLRIYPNPTTGNFKIDLNNYSCNNLVTPDGRRDNLQEFNIEIRNVFGGLIETKQCRNGEQINVSSLPAGIYYAKITHAFSAFQKDEKWSEVKKLVKL